MFGSPTELEGPGIGTIQVESKKKVSSNDPENLPAVFLKKEVEILAEFLLGFFIYSYAYPCNTSIGEAEKTKAKLLLAKIADGIYFKVWCASAILG